MLKARAMATGSSATAMAEFEGFGGVAGGAETGVDDDGDAGLFDDDGDLRAGFQSAVAPDGRAEGHDGGGAGVFEAFGEDGVGVDVGEDGETFGHEDFGGTKSLDRIGKEVVRVGMDLEFDPFGESGAGGEAGEADGFFGVHRAAGVGQQEIFFGIDEIEDVGERVAGAAEVGAVEGDGDDLRAACFEGVAHEFVRGELAGAEEEARREGAPGDDERPRHGAGVVSGAAASPATSSWKLKAAATLSGASHGRR